MDPHDARAATAADVDGIVRLSALHRAQLQIANRLFWNIHSEADERFAEWMRMSLTFPDRAIFVSGPPTAVAGFIIAQPGSPLHLPPVHVSTRLGLIDDFYADAFQPSEGHGEAAPVNDLLAAAESSFRYNGIETALAIYPARMTAKARALRSYGYTEANLWMAKKPGTL